MLETADQVLEALGATNIEVARITGAKPSAVSNWRLFGKFPSRKFRLMKALLQERGLDAPDRLWGQE